MVDYKVGITKESATNVKKLLPKSLPQETINLLEVLTSDEYKTIPPKVKGSRMTLSNLVSQILLSFEEF